MVELLFDVKKQNIQVFTDVYNVSKAREMAESVKGKAFGMISSLIRAFDKEDDVTLTYAEKRYEPFWHIKANSYYEYKRSNKYQFDVDAQVRAVKINNKVFDVDEDKPICIIDGEDHCFEEYEKEMILDAVTGKESKTVIKYLEFASKNIKQTEDLMGDKKVVVPAKVRASFLVREFIKDLIKPVDADKIIQETVEVKKLILYFRPIYAFEFTEESSGKKKIIEVDAITGETKVTGTQIFKRAMDEVVSEDTLFEVGAELASTVIPGAAVGAAIGKHIVTKRKEKKKIKEMKKSMAARTTHKKKKK